MSDVIRIPVLASIIAVLAGGLSTARADNWPQWRGPTGQGVCAERDLPLHWSPAENVKWKTELPAPGNSTPVVWDGKVFITQATEKGRRRATICFDRRDGSRRWAREVAFDAAEPTHDTNPYCSASPVTDGERVIVSHGSAGVYAYGMDGDEAWSRDLGEFHHIWGNAASPVIHGDLCYLNCGPGARTFLIALNKKTGETVWKKEISGGQEGGDNKSWTGSWSTPILTRDGGRSSLLMSFPGRLISLDPADGQERWTCSGLGKLVYASPIAAEGVAVSLSGFSGPPMAVRLGGEGDVTGTHRLWREDRAPQQIGSGVIHEGRFYIVNDRGIAECKDLKTGEQIWRERLGTRSWSSIVRSGDRLYTADHGGNFFVIRASSKFEKLAHNKLGERTLASIAVSNGDLFLRTYRHLWCIGKEVPTVR